ncbi:predicted protein [Uncinocarpus reesii 1704]|uniref:Uncharacterized protein n=1 Tax=Uncinocarpus reesii (strain UAMH 1704) TaxID=336963 RepID=C4JP82_UNCRE|nr:uncharacterized protein UREG_04464 [Uncinocarpus reesii 1704]EEP79618.1 predicted protein [Uncinocarpus reesii 1704]
MAFWHQALVVTVCELDQSEDDAHSDRQQTSVQAIEESPPLGFGANKDSVAVQMEHLAMKLNRQDEKKEDKEFLNTNSTHVDVNTSHDCFLGLTWPSHTATD